MSKQEKRKRTRKIEKTLEPVEEVGKFKKLLIWIWPEKIFRKPQSRFSFDFFTHMELPKPPKELFFVGVLMFFLYIISGGIYNLARRTIPLNYQQIGDFVEPVFFWKDLHEQFILEGVIFAILVGLAFVGTYLIYESTKNFYRPSTSYAFLLIGLLVFFLAFGMIEILIHQKITSFYSIDF